MVLLDAEGMILFLSAYVGTVESQIATKKPHIYRRDPPSFRWISTLSKVYTTKMVIIATTETISDTLSR